MKSNAGELTRQRLLDVARANFYERGFYKTTMQSISNEVGIAVGSMAYYFKKKEDIAAALLNEYISKIYSVIEAYYERKPSTFTLHAIASIPYYSNMLDDEQTKCFYLELLKSGSPQVALDSRNPFKQQMDDVNLLFMYESNISYSDFYKKASSAFALAGRNKVIRMLFEGEFNSVPIVQVINYVTEGSGLLLNLPKELIDEALSEAIEFNTQNDLTDIQLLK